MGQSKQYSYLLQVRLTDEQREFLRREAMLSGLDMASVVRDVIDKHIESEAVSS